jgi:hypothetical protein
VFTVFTVFTVVNETERTMDKKDVVNEFGISAGLKSEQYRADEIGVHRLTLLRARFAGRLGYVRIGNRIFYSPSHIVAWLRQNEKAPKPDKTKKAA